MIIFDSVSKAFPDGTIALRDLSLTFSKGEFIFVVGRSGAGKSTLLKLITRELRPSKGIVQVGKVDVTSLPGRKIPTLRRQIGTIFQDFKLLADRTVAENVAVPLQVIGTSAKDIDKRVFTVLKRVNLEKKAHAFPAQLSGGEAQRTGFARAIVHGPPVLLADEPTGDLDRATAMALMELLDQYHKEGSTVIMATHNADIVNTMRRRVVALDDGKVVSDKEKGAYAI